MNIYILNAGAMNVSRAGFGAGNHTSLHGVTCNGTESRLDSCQQLFLDCNHSQYAVGVKCPGKLILPLLGAVKF